MTAPIKSVLFVDYDSLYLSLRARDPGMARRFALRPGVWLEAIEAGLLLEPRGEEAARRRILMRRCYADPKLLGKARSAFTGQGFQIVDCPPLPGRERNSAEIHMVLDTIDALAHQTGFEEFILLSADSDLTPVIYRLRSYNRATAIYTTLTTSAGYRAIADGAIDEQALIALLAPTADAETPETTDDAVEENAQRPNGGERDGLAGLARRVHQATNVPLFSPRVYGELFRALTREVAENGYHFQTTAENVAARLSANGRNASRRQIAFVVKGLALKGHVFSTNDSPEKLADAFKEQVLYLARNAGVEIDEGMESLISTWIVGQNAPVAQAALPPPAAPAEAPVATVPAERAVLRQAPIPSPPLVPMSQQPQPAIQPSPASPPVATRPAPDSPMPSSRLAQPAPVAQPAQREARPISLQPISATMQQPARPIQVHAIADPAPQAELAEPPTPAPVERAPQPVAPVLAVRAEAPVAPIVQPVVAAPVAPTRRTQIDPESLLAEISSDLPVTRSNIAPPRARPARPTTPEPAAEETPRPSQLRPAPPRSAPGSAVVLRPPARRSSVATFDPNGQRDPIESSILAAIAQAVDVLVDDGEPDAPAAPAPVERQPPVRAQIRAAPPAPAPAPVESPSEDGDIGDEIQRILAAYSQNRKPPSGR